MKVTIKVRLQFSKTEESNTYCFLKDREYLVDPELAKQFVESGSAEYVAATPVLEPVDTIFDENIEA